MSLQQGLLLLGAGVFLLILLDALRRKIKANKQAEVSSQEPSYLDPEEEAKLAELARELPGFNKDLDPLFDDLEHLEVFDDDPIPLLPGSQQVQLSPANKAAAKNLIELKYPQQKEQAAVVTPVQSTAQKTTNQQPLTEEDQLSFLPEEADATKAAAEPKENLAWEKMRRKFELDPSFAEASRVSMRQQQKELALLQEIKTNEALRYGAVKKQTFDQSNDLEDLELPKKLKQAKPITPVKPKPLAQPEPQIQKTQPQEKLTPVTAKETKPTEVTPQPEPMKLSEEELQSALITSLEKNTWGQAQEFLILNLKAHPNRPFHFTHLAEFARVTGMQLSQAGVYHHLEENQSNKYLGYSLLNMLKPGNFLSKSPQENLYTVGLSLVMALPNSPKSQEIFERMLAVAKVLARNWGAELQDEHHSNLTQQTIEHYRQRIKDFEYQAKIDAKKASRKAK